MINKSKKYLFETPQLAFNFYYNHHMELWYFTIYDRINTKTLYMESFTSEEALHEAITTQKVIHNFYKDIQY